MLAVAALLIAACQPAAPAQPAAPPPAPAEKPAQPAPAKPAEKPAAKPAEKPAAQQPAEKAAPKPAAVPGAPPEDPNARRGGTLTLGTSKDLITTNVFINTQSVGQYIKETIWEPLINVDTQAQLVPALAESWDVSSDLQTFTFNLRQGVKFHDGQEMSADDVIWSMEYVMNPENGAIGNSRLAQIDRVERVDDHTVRVTTMEPGVTFLAFLSEIRALPIVPAGSLQVGQRDVGPTPPAGTGPFKFVEYVPNQRTVVERFDDYWGGAPYLDRVIFQLIPDDTVRFTALRAGDVDVIERIPSEWLPRVRAGEVTGIQIQAARDAGSRRIQINVVSPLMSNQQLREAVAYAIDRDQVLEEAWAGFGTPINARVPAGSVWHSVVPPTRDQDLERSRQLQQEAGYQGEEISFMARRGHENVAEPIQRMMTEAGFNVRLEILESAIVEEREDRGQFDIAIGGGSLAPDPSVSVRAVYYCEGEERRYDNRIDNDNGYCDDEVDSILDQLDAEPDQDKRLALFERFAEIVHNDVVNVYLGTEPRYFGWTDKVQNMQFADWQAYTHADGGLSRAWLAQ